LLSNDAAFYNHMPGKQLGFRNNATGVVPAPLSRNAMPALRRLLLLLMVIVGCRRAPRSLPIRSDSTPTRPLAEAPVVRGPTVVAFWLQASDTLAKDSGADLLDDFRHFTTLVAPALQEAEIALVATTADSVIVELDAGPRRVITLSGLDYPFGYVLVEPGYAETILTGVSTDEDLLDEVEWYFGLDQAPPDSAAGRMISARARPGRPGSARPARTASAGTRYWAAAFHAAGSHRRYSRKRRES
jgi:hypothetical protein